MKTRFLVLCTITAASALVDHSVFAADNKGMDGMKDMPGMSKPATKRITGTGVVKSVDVQKGTVTISHEPIKELNWPAMTMGFKVSNPDLLKQATVGKKVEFALEDRGGPTIVAIK